MKKKQIDILKEMRSLAKLAGGVHPYSDNIKIDDKKRATWTDGFILIRAIITEPFPPGIYRCSDMSPRSSNGYPNSDGFFVPEDKFPKVCIEVLHTARKIKPQGKESIAIKSDGTYDPFNVTKNCINLRNANIAVSLGLSYCTLDKVGVYRFSNDEDTIEMVCASMIGEE
jgi:hypothetical protein